MVEILIIVLLVLSVVLVEVQVDTKAPHLELEQEIKDMLVVLLMVHNGLVLEVVEQEQQVLMWLLVGIMWLLLVV